MTFIKNLYKLWVLCRYLSVSDKEIRLEFGGGRLSISNEGEIKIFTTSNYVINAHHIFHNCAPEFIEEVMSDRSNIAEVVELDSYRREKGLCSAV